VLLIYLFDCDDIGEMKVYVGCKVEMNWQKRQELIKSCEFRGESRKIEYDTGQCTERE
jgi:hypothetical protein